MKIKLLLLDNLIWPVMALLFMVGAVFIPNFASWGNLVNIVYHSTILCVLVMAQGIVLMGGHLDLSIDATLAFAPGLVLLLASKGVLPSSPLLLIGAMLLLGGGIGFFNGVCVAGFGMNSFMQSLSVSIMLRGAILFLIPLSIFPLDPSISWLGRARTDLGKVPVAVFAVLLAALALHLIYKYTVFGRNYMATGGNVRASYVAGIDTRRVLVAGFVLAGVLAAFAGLLTAGRQDSVSNTMGQGMVMSAFAGALLGGTSMNGGRGSIWGMVGGGIFLGMIANALNLLGVQVTLVHATQGALIFLALVMDRFRLRVRSRLLEREQLARLEQRRLLEAA